MKKYIIIPTRYASTRFPGKSLYEFRGKPLILHVWESAEAARELGYVDEVIIASGNPEIISVCKMAGAKVVVNSQQCNNGTERVADAIEQMRIPYSSFVMSLQSDVLFLSPDLINKVFKRIEMFGKCYPEYPRILLTIAQRVPGNPTADLNEVKVVLVPSTNRILYFSRAPVPFPYKLNSSYWLRHVGVYCTLAEGFLAYKGTDVGSNLVQQEDLEQLKFMAMNYHVMAVTTSDALVSVNLPADVDTLYDEANKINWPDRPVLGHVI